MSLINVFLSPSRALIGVDTEAINHRTGEFTELSKMIHLPHVNAVMAGRGIHGFLLILVGIISAPEQTTGISDFDSLAKAMPRAFEAAYTVLEQNRPDGIEACHLDSQQIVLVGWSSMQNRMRAICYSKAGPGANLEVIEIEEPGYIMPWNDAWGEAPEGSDRRTMIELALAQTQNVKQESPGTAMGGRLMLADLTRDSMAFSSAWDLSKPIQSAVQISFSREEWQKVIAGSVDAGLSDKVKSAQATM